MKRTAQVSAEHEVENEEAVVVVLESISHVDDVRVVNLILAVSESIRLAEAATDLFEEPALLDDVGYRAHLYASENDRSATAKRGGWRTNFALFMYLRA